MFKHLNLQLLLLWFVNYSGATDEAVSGILGGDATLLCESDATDIFSIDLSRIKSIFSCQNETCDPESDSQNGRVFKEGACGFFIKGLRLSDAGKYILRVYYRDDQTLQWTYQLCIQYTISVKKGEPLKLDVLLPNADKVEHQDKRTTGGKVVWSRTHGVRSDRMIIRDRKLIINNFTTTDTGTYEVLDSEGQILIMVTADIQNNFYTTSSAESEMSSTQQYIGLVLLLVVLVAGTRKKMQRCSRGSLHCYKGVCKISFGDP